MAMNEIPTLDFFAKSRWVVAPVEVTVAGSSARSAQLTAGIYVIMSDTECHFQQGGNTVVATTSSIRLPADMQWGPVFVSANSDEYIAVIQASAGGTLQIIRVE